MKKILFVFLALTILLISASCTKENNSTTTPDESILNATTDSTTIIGTEPTTSPIYQYDDVINNFFNKYNTVYQEAKIDANMISKYYHHGREHDDQVLLDIGDDVSITISSTYVNGGEKGVKVFIDIYNHTDISSVKEMYLLFTKVFNPDISEETLENTWALVTDTDYNNIIEADNLEYYYSKGSFLSIEGSF